MAPEAAVAEEERLRAEREVRDVSTSYFLVFGGDVEVDDVVVGPLFPFVAHHHQHLRVTTTKQRRAS